MLGTSAVRVDNNFLLRWATIGRTHNVKHQYFGDSRDLFKYDLLLDLAEAHGARRLTLIPMLTPPDTSGHGRLTPARGGSRNPAIYDFLRQAVASGQRDIRQLRELMSSLGVTYLPYRDDRFFDPDERSEYFEAVPNSSLENALIFFDPDTGLETGTHRYMMGQGPHKYLKYADLAGVWARAANDSVVVVYQHLQRHAGRRTRDIQRRLEDLSSRLTTSVCAAQRRDLAFLVAAKVQEIGRKMSEALKAHCSKHDLTTYHEFTLRPKPS